MSPSERAYLRCLYARTPEDARAIAQEWAVKPRRYEELPHGLGPVYEAEAFVENVTREWRQGR